MTSIFTKYTELDPALEARQIEAAHGSPVFDRWSFLDESRFNAQAAAALGVTLDVAASLDPRRARDELDTTAASYVAKAVHFDLDTFLSTTALSCTVSGDVAFSLWAKFDPSVYGLGTLWPTMWIVDPANAYNNAFSYGSFNNSALNLQSWLTPDGGNNTNEISVGNFIQGDDGWASIAAWTHFLGCARSNQADGSRLIKVYINAVSAAGDGSVHSNAPAQFEPLINGQPFFIGTDTFANSGKFVGDIADFWWASGVNLFDGSGNIPASTIAKFISGGKPVDPVNFPTGGSILLSGDAAFFATNQGTGGAFTLTGTLTNATTSPSD